MVYDSLWALAEGSSLLTSLVKPGNRIKFNQNSPRVRRDPIKREISTSDLPELILVSTGMSANLHQTSTSSSCTRNYEWIIATGDLIIVNTLLPVEWALFAAMANWKTIISSLQWNGHSFVKRANMTSVDNGLTDPERNRGIRGWSALWRCEVEMHFSTQEVIDAGNPTTTPEP